MDYGDLLTRSWRIVWTNKYLILLGFLAAIGGVGNPGSVNVNYSFGRGELTPEDLERFVDYMADVWPFVAGFGCLFLFIAIVFWLIRLTSQAGLISATARIDAGEKVTLGEAFSSGLSKLGRMIGIDLIIYGPFILLGLLAAGAAVVLASSAIGYSIYNTGPVPDDVVALFGGLGIFITCIVLLICVLVPVLLFAMVIYPFAQRGVVLQDLGVTASLGHGWRIVKSNLGDVILLVLLFIVIGIIYGVLVGIIVFPLSLLAVIPILTSVITGGAFGLGELFLLSGVGLCFGLLVAVLNSVLIAFRSTTVTLAYQHFLEKVG